MIEIKKVSKHFGTIAAVSDVSLRVGAGEVLGFLGPNGAGKSTTMKMAAGYLLPDTGTIRICGHDIATDTVAAQRLTGYLPEGAPAYGDMTVLGFLHFIAEARGLTGRTRAAATDAAIEKTELSGVLRQPIDTLSKGFRRRVGLAQAIVHNPPVLILDEPTDGLDPNQKHAVRELIRTMAADKAIIVSTHILEEVEAICTRATIIDCGHIVADGTPDELLARSRYRNAVHLSVPAADADRVETALNGLPQAAATERLHSEGLVRFTVFSRNGALLIETIGALANRERWPLREITAEAGRLDEVFRAITTHDTSPLNLTAQDAIVTKPEEGAQP